MICYLDFVVTITSQIQTLILDPVSPPMVVSSRDWWLVLIEAPIY